MRRVVITLFFAVLFLAAVAAAGEVYLNVPSSSSLFQSTSSVNFTSPYGLFTRKVPISSSRYVYIPLSVGVLVVNGSRYYRVGLEWPDPAVVDIDPSRSVAFLIVYNFTRGTAEWRRLAYNSLALYINGSVRIVWFGFWHWNAMGLNAQRGHGEVLIVRGCARFAVYNNGTAVRISQPGSVGVTAVTSGFPLYVVLGNVTWTHAVCTYLKEITPAGNVYENLTITARYDATFFIDPYFQATIQQGGGTAMTTTTAATTTTTTATTTTSTAGPGQPIGTAPPQQWQHQRPDGSSTTVGYGQTTLYSNRIYVYLYDVWGNVVTDAQVTCGNVRAQFNSSNLLYYCDGITSTTTVIVSHPKYYGVKFQADPGKIYVVMLYPSTGGVPNEPTPSSATQAYLVLMNPSPRTVQAEVRTPSGCVFNVQVGSATLNTYTLQPYSSLMVTVNGPSSGCDSGVVEVYADGKKVWSATWGSIKGQTVYVNVASDIKYPIDVYGPGGSYIGNVTALPGGLSGNWIQWLIIIGAAFIILVLLAIVLSRR